MYCGFLKFVMLFLVCWQNIYWTISWGFSRGTQDNLQGQKTEKSHGPLEIVAYVFCLHKKPPALLESDLIVKIVTIQFGPSLNPKRLIKTPLLCSRKIAFYGNFVFSDIFRYYISRFSSQREYLLEGGKNAIFNKIYSVGRVSCCLHIYLSVCFISLGNL